jgi:hypothetical protein
LKKLKLEILHLAIFEDELVKIFERCFGDKRNAIHITISLGPKSIVFGHWHSGQYWALFLLLIQDP